MNKTSPLSTVELRWQNRNRVYRYLTQSAPVTKQDLAQALSMSLPTLSQNLKELTALGLVQRAETADATVGRKPQLISAVPDARFALGAELSRGHVRLAAVDLLENELAFQCLDMPFGNDDRYAAALADAVERFLDENHLDRQRLLGVCLALPGLVGTDRNTLSYAPTLGVRQAVPCVVAAHIPYTVCLENDANCGGFAAWCDRAHGESAAYLSVGRGVGGAVFIDDKLYAGTAHRAAEFGHMCLHPEGRRCGCGRQGCVEAYCSTARLSDELSLSLEAFFTLLNRGDAACEALWADYLDDLALVVNNIHVVLDCDVILGGLLSPFLTPYEARLKARLSALDPFAGEGGYLRLSRRRDHSICVGAALRFTTKFISEV